MSVRNTVRLLLSAVPVMIMQSPLFSQCGITVSAGDDIYLCAPPTPTQLDGSIEGDYLNFMWTPTTGMTGANTLSPTVNVSQTTTYVLKASAADLNNNLVSNGDFEGGNSSFDSDYGYSPGNLWPEGLYDILDNPQSSHSGFSPCDDHTSGSGNMMVVNGAGSPNQNVWCQTVSINPNSQYVLSAWLTSVNPSSPALLQFSINGSVVGPIFSAGPVCLWQQFFEVWNSGTNSSATICIVNQNTSLGGNDFALDDIVFAPVCNVTDTVKVNVVNVAAAASPSVITIPCDGAEITLNGTGSSTGPDVTYSWDTSDGNIVSGGNTLTPVVNAPGAYTLTVAYNAPDGTVCEKSATVNVVLNPNQLFAWINPPLPLGCGSATTQLIGNSSQSGFSSYLWETADGNIVSGQDQRICRVDEEGTYTLTVTNTLTGCTATTEIGVTSTTTPPIAAASAPDTVSCLLGTVPVLSNGSSSGSGIAYSWTAITGNIVSGGNSATAIVDTSGIYVLAVTNTANNCVAYDTVAVIGDLAHPTFMLPAPAPITCTNDTISISIQSLLPSGSVINWSASGGGHIISGQNSTTPLVDSAGTYTVVLLNPANGCTSTASVSVISNLTPPVALADPAGQITCQSPSVTLTGGSAGPGLGYHWTASDGGNIVSGENTLAPVVNSAGLYTLMVLDSINGCVSSASTIVAADTNVVQVVANAPDLITCNVGTVALNSIGSSDGAAISYLWTTTDGNIVSGADTPNPAVDQPGTYQLLITNNANGCAGTDLAVVQTNLTPPDLSIAAPPVITCASPAIAISAQNSSGPGSYSYQWTASGGGNITSGENTLSPQVNAPGSYSVVATDLQNGCSASFSTTVSVNVTPPVAQTSVPGPITCTQTAQQVTGLGSSSGSGFSYQWTASQSGNISGATNGVSATAVTPGVYTIQVTDNSNGCTALDSVIVFIDTAPPAANAGLDATLTCNLVSLTLSGSNMNTSSANPQFGWTAGNGGSILSGAGTANPVINAPGTYTLTVTNPENGCTDTDVVEIFNDANIPVVNAGPAPTLTCALTQTNLDATASSGTNFTYSWTASGGGHILGSNTVLNPVVDEPGIYTLVVTNTANGCTRSSSVTALENVTPPAVDAGPGNKLTCDVTSLTLAGSSTGGNATYGWQTSGGNIVGGASTLSPQINRAGIYTLTATLLSNGCSASDAVQITVDTISPVFSIVQPALLTCDVTSVPLTANLQQPATSQASALWTALSGQLGGQANLLNNSTSTPGTYQLVIENTLNGCSATRQITVSQNIQQPTAIAAPGGVITCQNTSVQLGSTGSSGGTGFTYSWAASNGGIIVSGSGTPSPTVSSAGTYTLTIENTANGCTSSASTVVTLNNTPPVSAITQPEVLTCTRNSVTLNANASSSGTPFSAAWNAQGGGNIVSGQNTLSPVVNKTGTYILTVSNTQNGCTSSALVQVTSDIIPPDAEAGNGGELHCNQSVLTLNGTSSTPGAMQFSWSTANGNLTGATNIASAQANKPGIYTLVVTNPQNGCTAADNVLLTEVPPPSFAVTLFQPTCKIATGVAEFSAVSGGKAPFEYSFNGGQTFGNATELDDLQPGSYSLVVKDDYGCTADKPATINPPFLPALSIDAVDLVQFGDSIRLQPATNIAPGQVASWEWSPAANLSCTDCRNPWAKPAVSTEYLLTVRDVNDCSAQARVQVRVNRQRNIYAPNVFSPNDDGENERFIIYGKGVKEIRTLQIFDRWGSLLWRADSLTAGDENAGWDGTSRGEPMNPAVFVWWAEIEFIDGLKEIYFGDVTVVR